MKIAYFFKLLENALHFPVRKRLNGRILIRKIVVLDFNNLEGCSLFECQLVYFGFGGVVIANSNIDKCQFTFAGPAANALKLLKAVGKVAPEIVEGTFPEAFAAMRDALEQKP